MKNQANPEYMYFVYDIYDDTIFAGNEYREDALDVCDEANELDIIPQFKVYSAKYLMTRMNVNPYDFGNWSNYKESK
tara:strand:+ start:113 stop:343 length:231 start_codon:yes stop_codon:yes gene_type:complete